MTNQSAIGDTSRLDPAARPDLSLRDLILAARPQQWIKNIVCLAAVTFADRLFVISSVLRALLAFACFCLASSAIYILNDIRDRRMDQAHPVKRQRPIAAGRLGTAAASMEAGMLAAVSLTLSMLLPERFRWVLLLFILLNILYSLVLKQIPLLDVMSIALGFVFACNRALKPSNRLRVPGWFSACFSWLCSWLPANAGPKF